MTTITVHLFHKYIEMISIILRIKQSVRNVNVVFECDSALG